jgi:hypothetical protein
VKIKFIIALMLIATVCSASTVVETPDTPKPVDDTYAAGFSLDNQLYLLQGTMVTMIVGGATKRPWLGAVAGVGSCALYRGIHDQMHVNDRFFGYNRMEYCAIGSAAGYGMAKLFHFGKTHGH